MNESTLNAAGVCPIAELFQAAHDGKKLEREMTDKWTVQTRYDLAYCLSHGAFDQDEWRIAEPPKFVPWEFEDAPEIVKVIRKSDGTKALLYLLSDGFRLLTKNGELNGTYTFEEALTEFEQLDKLPCGKAAQS